MKSFFKSLIKQDPIQSSLTRLLLFAQNTSSLNLNPLMKFYDKTRSQHKQQDLIETLIIQIQKRKQTIVKLKILMYLFSISKISTFDISELITRKKLKLFSEDNKKSPNLTVFDLSPSTKENYLHKYLIMNIYNYMIKLSANEELYNTCRSGEVPEDQIFRKGSRIRYIWVFKIFNLINLLLPLLSPLLILIDKFPKENIFIQILEVIKKDIAIYLNFVTKCIDETSGTNPFLLPYNDCLQYYECVKQYKIFKSKNQKLIQEISVFVPQPQIGFMKIDQQMFAQLEILAMRIQLISTSLKSSNTKPNQRLVTQYNQKVEKYQTRLNTLGN